MKTCLEIIDKADGRHSAFSCLSAPWKGPQRIQSWDKWALNQLVQCGSTPAVPSSCATWLRELQLKPEYPTAPAAVLSHKLPAAGPPIPGACHKHVVVLPGRPSLSVKHSLWRGVLTCKQGTHRQFAVQDGQTLEAVLLWIDKEPLKGSLVFIVRLYTLRIYHGYHARASMDNVSLPGRVVCTTCYFLIDSGVMMQAADIIGVTVLFPGAIFAMAGGAIFGVGYGCLLVWIATSLGQTLAFIVGRCAATDPASDTLHTCACTHYTPVSHFGL